MAIGEILSTNEELLTLIKKIIPSAFITEKAEDEIAQFTQTGLISASWLQQIFEKDPSSNMLAEIHDLMDTIHEDPSSEEEFTLEIAKPPKKSESPIHLSKATILKEIPRKDTSTTITILPESTIPINLQENSIPAVKKKKSNFFPKPQKNPPIKSVRPQATQLAEQLFTRFIGSTTSEDKKLNLIALRDIVARQLPDHTVGHDPHGHLLTLYDDINHPVASFDAKKFEIISI